jgi:hypothetical protein
MIKCISENKIAEVTIVQPKSFKLLTDLCNIIFPETEKKRPVICSKEKENENIKYSTVLEIKDKGECYVNGETDKSLCFNDICMMVWEDKKLDENIDTDKHKAQIFAEIKGNAEAFKEALVVEPPSLDGILTSGRLFIWAYRTFDEKAMFLHTKKIDTMKINESDNSLVPDLEAIDIISRILMASFNSMKQLMDIYSCRVVQTKLKSPSDSYTYGMVPTTKKDPDDKDDDGENGDKMRSLTRQFTSTSLKQSNSVSSKNKNNTSNNKNTSGKENTGKKERKRVGLQEYNTNISNFAALTTSNLSHWNRRHF